jgi:hypothetical protein
MTTMLKTMIVTASAAFAILFVMAGTEPAAAATPGCKNRVNPYVACTSSFKAKTPRRAAIMGVARRR